MRTRSRKSSLASKRHSRIRTIVLIVLLISGTLGWFMLRSDPANNKTPVANSTKTTTPTPPTAKTVTPLPNVQSLVDNWAKSNSGEYSIVVDDLEADTQLAAYRPDEPYFAASIYKLYVAYLDLMDVQAGKVSLDDPYLNGWDRARCLDEMIRNSYSPCAEKMWGELGREASTERLKPFGLTGTDMVGLITTAHDVNIILGRLNAREELNEKSTLILLDAMKGQKYRDAIPKGIPGLTVYDKVGFRDLVEYHDVAIVTLPNGRNVAITILTRNAGTRRIADITSKIFAALQK